jgi:hypothetical protein
MMNPGKKTALGADKRKGSRYGISPTFPLKAVLALIDPNARTGSGAVSSGKLTIRSHAAGKDWPGTLVDLSATGASVRLNLAAVAFPEDPCRIKFSLGSYQLEIPCMVAHFLCDSHFATCGVQFVFPDAETEKAYLQVLEPVIIGTSLTPDVIKPDDSGRQKEQYRGKNSSMLTVWRPFPGGEVTSFDFRMNRYGVRWSAGLSELSTYGIDESRLGGSKAGFRPPLKLKLKAPPASEGSRPNIPLTESEDEEVRWLFCLAVSNLSLSVADDVRRFLLSLVVA